MIATRDRLLPSQPKPSQADSHCSGSQPERITHFSMTPVPQRASVGGGPARDNPQHHRRPANRGQGRSHNDKPNPNPLEPTMRTLLTLLALVSLPTLATLAGPLNDTGIDFCRDHVTGVDTPVTPTTNCTPAQGGQDARYGRDPASARNLTGKIGAGSKGFDFTKIANNGTTLAASATLGTNPTDWACTYDNTTGLMWEVKTTSGLRSESYSYTWYDSVHNYGGNPGTASGGICETAGRCDTEKFAADVNAATLCNHNDWRMPTFQELYNLADRGITYPGPTIDATYFPYTMANYFWSGSPHAGYSDHAWLVYFGNGSGGWLLRSDPDPVRLVRAGQ